MRRARKTVARREGLPEGTPAIFLRPDDAPSSVDNRFCGEPKSKINYAKGGNR